MDFVAAEIFVERFDGPANYLTVSPMACSLSLAHAHAFCYALDSGLVCSNVARRASLTESTLNTTHDAVPPLQPHGGDKHA